jgi:hypothetical protein
LTTQPPANRAYNVVPYCSFLDSFFPETDFYKEWADFAPTNLKSPSNFADPFSKLREAYEADIRLTNENKFRALRNRTDI